MPRGAAYLHPYNDDFEIPIVVSLDPQSELVVYLAKYGSRIPSPLTMAQSLAAMGTLNNATVHGDPRLPMPALRAGGVFMKGVNLQLLGQNALEVGDEENATDTNEVVYPYAQPGNSTAAMVAILLNGGIPKEPENNPLLTIAPVVEPGAGTRQELDDLKKQMESMQSNQAMILQLLQNMQMPAAIGPATSVQESAPAPTPPANGGTS
jgi:hypothetical protein